MREWLSCRKVAVEEIDGAHDLQAARLFPVCSTIEELGLVMRWMISEPELQEGKEYGNVLAGCRPMRFPLMPIFVVWLPSVIPFGL